MMLSALLIFSLYWRVTLFYPTTNAFITQSLSKWKLTERRWSPNIKSTSSVVRRHVEQSIKKERTSDNQINIPSTLSDNKISRPLGSEELLMLPRQYSPNKEVVFPQMTHVCAVVLSATPSTVIFEQALQEAMAAHPLLNARVEGDGEPEKRIDIMQMVREGEPNPCTFVADPQKPFQVEDVLSIYRDVKDKNDLTQRWKKTFSEDLDDKESSWCNTETGPLWKIEWHRSSGDSADDTPCALVFSLNHAISDQSSLNRFIDQILQNVDSLEAQGKISPASKIHKKMPLALEDSVLGLGQRYSDVQTKGFSLNTLSYVLGKAAEGFKNPVILPDTRDDEDGRANPLIGALQIIFGQTAGGEDKSSQERQTALQFKTLDKETTTALLKQCKNNGVTMSNALTAAITMTVSDFIGEEGSNQKSRNYKVLQSLDMRRFGEQLDKAETMSCMAGSHDLMLGPCMDGSGKALRKSPTKLLMKQFWDLAQESHAQTNEFVKTHGPEEAVRVFDCAMTISDMNNLVHLAAQSKDTKGRAYSAGVTNAGVYERQQAYERKDSSERGLLKVKRGRYKIEDLYYATPHVRSGCLYPLSCMTVDGEFKFTFHPMSPVVSQETNDKFADAFVELLQVVAKGETAEKECAEVGKDESSVFSALQSNFLPILTAALGTFAVASHANGYQDFFNSVLEMKRNTSPEEFWPALNFWIFFAVGHPILQPVLWLSDVLHGTPGPKVGDLVPLLFLAGNAVFIAAVAMSHQFRTSVNIAAVAAFLSYIGAGLDGTAGLGDFNLALDDGYKGKVVKGCPSYDDVRQPSMNNFDLEKYQGLWYEHKFHDWTQFKEVYDTTLNIKLTDGGTGWVDDFAVKGPAPKAAKLSWDKSPVANGAHYFLFGRVDPNDPPGILRESGFGVEFPNYIVDTTKDPVTGEYKESIQFQCLERGGVRVFEGINFMSRNPVMTDEEMAAMHARAEKAGMYPYGASPEQMHLVERRPVDAPPIDNNWQAMWRAIGFDRLLEMLTESIEDGGRN